MTLPEDRDLRAALAVDAFPRSGAYDPRWQIENLMGPNVLWLTEFLTRALNLQAGMRVLDMGAGKALSSIFLAREFGGEVWAVDLWIDASENWERVREASIESLVHPIHAEAHALPFADGFFDVAVSMDAYHYFGTDDLYLGYYSRFVKAGGQVGIVVPGLTVEIGAAIPESLVPFWHWDFCSFHSPEWWRDHWAKTGLVDVTLAARMPDGGTLWLRWLEICAAVGGSAAPEEEEMLRIDAGRYLGFTRLVARKRAAGVYKL